MKIKTVDIINFRGISEFSLDLSDNINVFIGSNGSGKSTVLDAIAILLSWYTARLSSINSSGQQIKELDIKNEENSTILKICVNTDDSQLRWKKVQIRKGTLKNYDSDFSEINENVRKIQEEIGRDSQNISLPLVAYYPINRAVIDIPDRIRNKHNFDSPLSAYEGSLTIAANFRTFFEWFREQENIDNEQKLIYDFPEGKIDKDYKLDIVRKAIEKFTGFQNLRVRYQPLRMELIKDGKYLRVDQLSYGEKCLVATVGDLARRLIIANPSSKNPLEGKGIILIDEIEMHLHPSWECMIIPKLNEVFPNCQFIVTTHSPLVISEVKNEHIYLMKNTEKGIIGYNVERTYGKNYDRILEDIMDVSSRPIEIVEQLSKLFLEIKNGNASAYKDRLHYLEDTIGSDPQLEKAKLLIRRREIIGK